MRNLQKILALVLALVMSLSLMASAGARDFTDGDQIDETFAESVDVLTGLEVFQGYPSGDFQPKGDITRAEVAAIIYRIATGDVTDSQVGIYADYNKFSDVPSDNWAAGYINYCANAEYIKGRGDGKFYPQDKVTGYEALAMILRVVGYDKNGEFTGADWQVQTAATANQRKVTKNVNAGTLGNPASRETVAELLCQAILINTVNYTLAFGYQISTDPEDTIAYETFEMERLTGIVTGNEEADLDNTSPMPAGQTRLENADGTKTLANFATDLSKIGLSVRAYVVPEKGTDRSKLVTADVYETEENHVYDEGAYVSDITSSSFSSTLAGKGINSIANAEYYRNYDPLQKTTSDWRVEYVIDLSLSEYDAVKLLEDNGGWITVKTARDGFTSTTARYGTGNAASNGNSITNTVALSTSLNRVNPGPTAPVTYHKIIPANVTFTAADLGYIKDIFTNADRNTNYEIGEVYVATTSRPDRDDISDEISHPLFVSTYLKTEQIDTFTRNGLGDQLKVIDNNNDGIADYILQTVYTVGKVVSVNGDTVKLDQEGKTWTECDGHNPSDTPVNEYTSSNSVVKENADEELAVGDVVIYAKIDGNLRTEKAESVTAKVQSVDRSAKTVTVEGNETPYKESNVHEHSDGLAHGVTNLAGANTTSYTMYLDKYGNLAAFTEAPNSGFVLITDGWYRNTIGGDEFAVRAYIDGSQQVVELNRNGSLFVNRQGDNNAWGQLKTLGGTTGTLNGQNNNIRPNVVTTVAVINDGTLVPVDRSTLYARQIAMIDMDNNVIPGRDNILTSKGDAYNTTYSAPNAYDQKIDDDVDVRALSTTTYYFVYRLRNTANTKDISTVVREYTGYANIPSVRQAQIEDVYVVGTRAANAANNAYYTADVVVVELNDQFDYSAAEQVFIPGFPNTITNVTEEQVEVIRGTGVKETVTIDMAASGLYTYNPANTGADYGYGKAGLYVMSESSKAGVYVVRHMNYNEIANNRYLVGYVNKDTATGLYDWTSVDLMYTTAPTTWPKDTVPTRVNPTHKTLNGGEASKQNVPDSKYYNLQYNTAGWPTLSDNTSREDVLAQNKGIENWVPSWSNEWSDSASSGQSRNEVLIAYNDKNEIIYAVSFREFSSGTTRDFAQNVWYSLLPAQELADDIGVEHYGVGDNDPATNPAARTNFANGEIDRDRDSAVKNIKVNWLTANNAYTAVEDAAVPTVKVTVNNYTAKLNYVNIVKTVGGQSTTYSAKIVEDTEAAWNDTDANAVNPDVEIVYNISISYNDNIDNQAKFYSYTLTRMAKETGTGTVSSTNDSVVTNVRIEDGKLAMSVVDAGRTTLQGLQDVLASDLARMDTKIEVKGYDTKGIQLDMNQHVNGAAKIEVIVTNEDNVSTTYTVALDGVDNDVTYYTVTLGTGMKAYRDNDFTQEFQLDGNTFQVSAADGGAIFVAAEGIADKFTIAQDGQADVDLTQAAGTLFYDRDGNLSWTVYQITGDVTITCTLAAVQDTPATKLEPTLTMSAAFKAGLDGGDYNNATNQLVFKDATIGGQAVKAVDLNAKDAYLSTLDATGDPVAKGILANLLGIEIDERGMGYITEASASKTYVSTGTLTAYWDTYRGGKLLVVVAIDREDNTNRSIMHIYINDEANAAPDVVTP